jgi:hypothetical protein
MRKGGDFIVSESGHAMSAVRRLTIRMSVMGLLQGLAGLLVPRQVILLSLLLGDTMGVRGAVMQFGRAWMVLVMGSVVVTSRHKLKTPDLP